MNARTPMPVDILVGRNIRVLRLARGLSQSQLADHVGLTYQQVQKYETGANRMVASRLSRIADILQVPLLTLFEGSASADRLTRVDAPGMLLLKPHALRLLRAFAQIQDQRVRSAILKLVAVVSGPNSARHSRPHRNRTPDRKSRR